MNHDKKRFSSTAQASACLAAIALLLSACSSDPAASGGTGGDDAGTGEPPAVNVGKIIPAGESCTESHTLCVGIHIPETLEGEPTLLRMTLYKSIPPTTPPDGIAGLFPEPALSAGDDAHLSLSDSNQSGDFFVVGALFMPGGGNVIPVDGVDYFAFSSKPYHLDGTALNIDETLTFQK